VTVLDAVILDCPLPGLTSEDSDAAHARGVLDHPRAVPPDGPLTRAHDEPS
jgi:hypothetical protein